MHHEGRYESGSHKVVGAEPSAPSLRDAVGAEPQ